jgi:hypothetical protein
MFSFAPTARTGMRIRVELFRKRLHFQQALVSTGWHIVDPAADPIEVHHPEVHDEETARRRLAEIGLLTSSHVRVEFGR